MKKLSYLMAAAFVSLMVFTSCRPSMLFRMNGGKSLEPSANVIKKDFKNLNFKALDVSTVGKVVFVQTTDSNCRVEVEAPDNYIQHILIESKDGKLSISNGEYNLNGDNIRICIYSPTLKSIENSGAGDLKISKLKVPSLDIDNSGAANLKIEGLEVNTLVVDNSGAGNMELKGKTTTAAFVCSGAGDVDALHLHATTVTAEVSGAGNVKCYASESIEAEASGAGDLKFAGNPKNRKMNSSGAGSIKTIKE